MPEIAESAKEDKYHYLCTSYETKKTCLSSVMVSTKEGKDTTNDKLCEPNNMELETSPSDSVLLSMPVINDSILEVKKELLVDGNSSRTWESTLASSNCRTYPASVLVTQAENSRSGMCNTGNEASAISSSKDSTSYNLVVDVTSHAEKGGNVSGTNMNVDNVMESESSVQHVGTTSTVVEKPEMHLLEEIQRENKEVDVSSHGNKRKLELVIEKKKKRSKQHRILKTTLAILKPDSQTVQEEKAANFAQAYFWKVKSRLTENALTCFIQELVSFESGRNKNVADLYKNVENLLTPHTDLIDEFLTFLLPHQALEVGRFMDYFLLIKMKEFFTKLKGCLFPKQVQQVLGTLEHLVGKPNVSLSDVRNAILPHLKSSPLLSDYFLALLPGERPPDSLQKLTECEHMDCSDEQNDCVETVLVPDCYDPYGGENCPCACHISQMVHCTSCGVKFINGRVYMQYGKILRPAKVVFKGENQNEMLESKWRFIGNSKSRTQAYKRIHPSPFKSHTSHNYDDHRIGAESEDDVSHEHGKSALANKKSPKMPRMKPAVGSKHKNTTKSGNRKEETIVKEIISVVEGVTPLVIENFHERVETSNSPLFLNKKDFVSSFAFHTKKPEQKVVTSESIDLDKVNELCVDKETVCKENCKSTKIEDVSNGKVNKNNEKEKLLLPVEENFKTSDSDQTVYTDSHLNCMIVQKGKSEECFQAPVCDVDSSSGIRYKSDENVKDDKKVRLNTTVNTRQSKLSDYSEEAEITNQMSTAEETNEADNATKSQNKASYAEEKLVMKAENKISYLVTNDNRNVTEASSSGKKINENIDEEGSCMKTKTEISEDSGPGKGELKMSLNLGNLQTKTPKSTKMTEVLSWTREEDKVILQAFQQESDTEQTFNKINQRLSNRTVEEIQTRFQVLMQLLKEMTSATQDENL